MIDSSSSVVPTVQSQPSFVANRNSAVAMVRVHFSRHLLRHLPVPEQCVASGSTIREVIDDLERRFPGLTTYILHENGVLRQHVNVFLENRLLKDREALSDTLDGVEEISIMQALSGG